MIYLSAAIFAAGFGIAFYAIVGTIVAHRHQVFSALSRGNSHLQTGPVSHPTTRQAAA